MPAAVLHTPSGGVCSALGWVLPPRETASSQKGVRGMKGTHLLGGSSDGMLILWPRVELRLEEDWAGVTTRMKPQDLLATGSGSAQDQGSKMSSGSI